MKVSASLLAFISSLSLYPVNAAPLGGSTETAILEKRQFGANRNDVVNGNGCKDVTVLFARGTTEAGNVGSVAGPPLFNALGKQVDLAVQGIDYPADVAGFLQGGDAGGSKLMADLVGQVMQDCPNTKLVMSGYSQGGQLVHNAAKQLSAAETNFVNSVVIFGDPNNGDAVGQIPNNKVKVFCNAGDNICAGGTLILLPHLTYGQDAGDAAAFVAQQANVARKN